MRIWKLLLVLILCVGLTTLLMIVGCSKSENPVSPAEPGQPGSTPVYKVSSVPVSIVLVQQSTDKIALRGTGRNESCVLVFQVKDSLNRPVANALVNFRIGTGPGGSEFISPSSAYSDTAGKVTATVTSGTIPGVVQIIASTRGDTVKASPVFLAMGAGLPDSAGVSIGATELNIAGRVYANLSTTIVVSVCDRYGSPVAEGTMVSFRTIPEAKLSDFAVGTNKEGNASVRLISTTNYLPTSLVPVWATTMGDRSYRQSDSLIERVMYVLFSGPTAVPTLGSDAINLTVPNGEARTFSFEVTDDRGFPLVGGSKIKLTVAAADTVKNDIELLFGTNGVYTIEDANLPGPGRTQFTATILDKGRTNVAGFLTFGIEITSTNGNYVNPNWFTGYVSAGGTGIYNLPASIVLADSSVKTLYLAETGLPQTSGRLYFKVYDALGNPIRYPTVSVVNFALISGPPGTTLSKASDSTNANGLVWVDITAGNEPGVAQVVATTLGVDGLISAYSLPIEIAHGLPDSNRIILTLDKKNMYNRISSIENIGTINLYLYDSYGYYAAPQRDRSDVVISTTGGWVDLVPQSVQGRITIGLHGGLPEPNDPILGPGFGYIYADVRTRGGRAIRSVPFLFSYEPQIAFLNPAIIDTTVNEFTNTLQDGSSYEVEYAVWDKNRNPISSDNSITVTVSGPVAGEIEVTGDVNISKLPDTQDKAMTLYRFTVRDRNPGSGSEGIFKVTVKVTGESGTATRTITGYLLAPNVLGGKTSGYAKSITLVDPLKSRTIYVRGTGGSGTGRPETVTLEFEARDSLGRLVDAGHAVMMHFQFYGESFGASIERDSGLTDANGKFTTVVRSGTQSGVPYVFAYGVVNGDTIKSGLIQIMICSGFPDPSRFSVSAKNINFPGMQMDGLKNVIRVQLGDRYGNPVPENTPAWFSCTHGVVQTADAYTNKDGIIEQVYFSNGTRPEGANVVPGMPEGFAFVKVRTMGENGLDIIDSIPILWSGKPVVTVISGPNPFTVPHTGSAGPWYFEVRDSWGNPLSAGTTIKIECEGAKVDMDPVTLPDTHEGANWSHALGITDFSVSIHDPHGSNDNPYEGGLSTTLRVRINHPVYGEFLVPIASGVIDPP